MTQINFKSNERYQDYNAALYFKACGFEGVSFSPKVVSVGDEKVILVHIRATAPDGKIYDLDIWPRNKATEEDLKVDTVENFEFRIGFYTDEKTGEVITGAPKHLLCHGEKREYNG